MSQVLRPSLPFHPSAAAPPLVVAHRGGSLEAPENTLRALRTGLEAGSDWLEVDVGLSQDGVPIILHDDSLLRTTGQARLLADCDAADLAVLRAAAPQASADTLLAMSQQGVAAAPPFADDGSPDLGVPTLREALAIPRSRYMLELKRTSRPAEFLAAVGRDIAVGGAGARVALASFDAELLQLASRLLPDLPHIGVAETVPEARAMLQQPIACLAVACGTASEIWSAVPPQIALWCWTVYSAKQAEAMRQVPVAGIITDAPKAVLTSFGQGGGG